MAVMAERSESSEQPRGGRADTYTDTDIRTYVQFAQLAAMAGTMSKVERDVGLLGWNRNARLGSTVTSKEGVVCCERRE